MSTTVSAVFIQLAVTVLPLLGISVGTEQLTQAVQTFIVIGTGLWIWYQRVSKGDVTIFGGRKG